MQEKLVKDMLEELYKISEERKGLTDELQNLIFDVVEGIANKIPEGTKVIVPEVGSLEVRRFTSKLGSEKWLTINGRLIDTREPGSTFYLHGDYEVELPIANEVDFLDLANNLSEIIEAFSAQQKNTLDQLRLGIEKLNFCSEFELTGYKTIHVINEGTKDEIRIKYNIEDKVYLVAKGSDYRHNEGNMYLVMDLFQLAEGIENDELYLSTCKELRKFTVSVLGLEETTHSGEFVRLCKTYGEMTIIYRAMGSSYSNYGTIKLGDLCNHFDILHEVNNTSLLSKEVTIELNYTDELEDLFGNIEVVGLGEFFESKISSQLDENEENSFKSSEDLPF